MQRLNSECGVFTYNRMVTFYLTFTMMLPTGVHSVKVLYDDTSVPKSPFQVTVSEGCDPTRVVAKGPGLEEALTEKPNKFSIITRYCSFLN